MFSDLEETEYYKNACIRDLHILAALPPTDVERNARFQDALDSRMAAQREMLAMAAAIAVLPCAWLTLGFSVFMSEPPHA